MKYLAALDVKSKASAFGEIVRFAHGEIKSVLHSSKTIFTREADSTRPQGRISLKKGLTFVSPFFWYPLRDSNPGHPD